MLKKIIVYSSIFFLLLSSTFIIFRSILQYTTDNLVIRNSFYFVNDVNQKGTHWGFYAQGLLSYNQYKRLLFKLNLIDYVKAFSLIDQIDPTASNFIKEFEIISILYELSKKSLLFKRETAIFIPKKLDIFWNITCDSHMPPFIVPGITGMAMIGGLPDLSKHSCYTHLLEYGFYYYYKKGKKAELFDKSYENICEIAKQEDFIRVIEITVNVEDEIIINTHNCEEVLKSNTDILIN